MLAGGRRDLTRNLPRRTNGALLARVRHRAPQRAVGRGGGQVCWSSSATGLHRASSSFPASYFSRRSRTMRRHAAGDASTACTWSSRERSTWTYCVAIAPAAAARRSSDAARRHLAAHHRRGRPGGLGRTSTMDSSHRGQDRLGWSCSFASVTAVARARASRRSLSTPASAGACRRGSRSARNRSCASSRRSAEAMARVRCRTSNRHPHPSDPTRRPARPTHGGRHPSRHGPPPATSPSWLRSSAARP